MKYIILRSRVKKQTVLVSEDEFEDCAIPGDYFVGSPDDAKKVGEVEIEGDTDELDCCYISE